jgi:hypothetical protein
VSAIARRVSSLSDHLAALPLGIAQDQRGDHDDEHDQPRSAKVVAG